MNLERVLSTALVLLDIAGKTEELKEPKTTTVVVGMGDYLSRPQKPCTGFPPNLTLLMTV